MAERRMLAKTITESDAFLDMPQSSQNLYFHLNMNADDDGFVNNPKKIQRTVGSSNDDLNILLAKSFLIPFESGVVVIKHWKIHNYIRSDRYKPTAYLEEKSHLTVKENGSYTMAPIGIPDVNQTSYQMETQVRLDEDRIGEVKEEPVFSKAEAFNPNTQNQEQRFQQIKTAWNANCKPTCNIRSTLTMSYTQRDEWLAGESQIVDIFATCKAIQNYGGILGNPQYEIDGHKGYSMLSFLIKGVEWYTDEARPFERCRKKQAGKLVQRETVPAEPNPFDAKNPFGGERNV